MEELKFANMNEEEVEEFLNFMVDDIEEMKQENKRIGKYQWFTLPEAFHYMARLLKFIHVPFKYINIKMDTNNKYCLIFIAKINDNGIEELEFFDKETIENYCSDEREEMLEEWLSGEIRKKC